MNFLEPQQEGQNIDRLSDKLRQKFYIRTSAIGKKLGDKSFERIQSQTNLINRKKAFFINTLNRIKSKKEEELQKSQKLQQERSRIQTIMKGMRKYPSKTSKKFRNAQSFTLTHTLKDINQIPTTYNLFWQRIPVSGYLPETRESATLTLWDDHLLLYGGLYRRVSDSVCLYDIKHYKWYQVQTKGVDVDPRFGHTAHLVNNNFLVFAGGTQHDQVTNIRRCLNSVQKLRLTGMDWQYFVTSGVVLPVRKYHISVHLGKYLFIHGGLTDKNVILDDCVVLNIEKRKWRLLEQSGSILSFRACHASAAVFQVQDFTNFKFQAKKRKQKQVLQQTGDHTIKEQGIYIFGGIDQNGQATNTLHIVKPGTRPIQWIIPATQGKPPSPRFHHSMVYHQQLNILIIYGGRSDSGDTYSCQDEIYILNLDKLLWASTKIYRHQPNARASHCCAIYGTRMFIFGGYENGKLASNDLYTMELDQLKAQSLVKRWTKNVKRLEEYKAKKIQQDILNRMLTMTNQKITIRKSEKIVYDRSKLIPLGQEVQNIVKRTHPDDPKFLSKIIDRCLTQNRLNKTISQKMDYSLYRNAEFLVWSGNTAKLKEVIDNNPEIVFLFNHNYTSTLIHQAATAGNNLIFQLLIEKGANTRFIDDKGNNLAHRAAMYGHLGILFIIQKLCPELLQQRHTTFKQKPLYTAVMYQKYEAVKFLSKFNNINEQFDDKTVLGKAIELGDIALVLLLISLGAKVTLFEL